MCSGIVSQVLRSNGRTVPERNAHGIGNEIQCGAHGIRQSKRIAVGIQVHGSFVYIYRVISERSSGSIILTDLCYFCGLIVIDVSRSGAVQSAVVVKGSRVSVILSIVDLGIYMCKVLDIDTVINIFKVLDELGCEIVSYYRSSLIINGCCDRNLIGYSVIAVIISAVYGNVSRIEGVILRESIDDITLCDDIVCDLVYIELPSYISL